MAIAVDDWALLVIYLPWETRQEVIKALSLYAGGEDLEGFSISEYGAVLARISALLGVFE